MSTPTHQWSRPHYGVQHIGSGSPREYWCTVESYGSFAVLTRWTPGCGLSGLQEMFPDAESARIVGFEWLQSQPKVTT